MHRDILVHLYLKDIGKLFGEMANLTGKIKELEAYFTTN